MGPRLFWPFPERSAFCENVINPPNPDPYNNTLRSTNHVKMVYSNCQEHFAPRVNKSIPLEQHELGCQPQKEPH